MPYIKACSEREQIRLNEAYNLLDEEDLRKIPSVKTLKKLAFYSINRGGNTISPGGNQIKHGENIQSIVKKIIEEKTKVNKTVISEDNSRKENPGDTSESVETVENPDEFEESPDKTEVFTELTYNGGKNSYILTAEYINQLKKLYPDVDPEIEKVKMQRWIKRRPAFKFKKSVDDFIYDWYHRVQESGGSTPIEFDDENHEFDEIIMKAGRKFTEKK